MMVKPSVTELLTKANNRYELVMATSKRARQIEQKRSNEKNAKKNATGSESANKIKEESAVTLAAEEIADGIVKIVKEGGEEQN